MDKAKKSLEQINAEAMSRRQALGRIGFLAGATAIAALTSDELFRKVGAEMQKRTGDNKVVEQVAKEFRDAGVAFATDPVGTTATPDPTGCWTPACDNACNNSGQIGFCLHCCACKKCACIEDIPQHIRYPPGQGIDCGLPANYTVTICVDYRRRMTACDNKAQACRDKCDAIPPPPTPTPVATPVATPPPAPAPE
jgi:hypothetical protein